MFFYNKKLLQFISFVVLQAYTVNLLFFSVLCKRQKLSKATWFSIERVGDVISLIVMEESILQFVLFCFQASLIIPFFLNYITSKIVFFLLYLHFQSF